jgi:hypothetical protein
LEIGCESNKALTFRYTNGALLTSNASVELRPCEEDNRELSNLMADEKQGKIHRRYKLSLLKFVARCLSITKYKVLVYIFEDHPIIYELKIGTLGVLKVTLMWQEDESMNC